MSFECPICMEKFNVEDPLKVPVSQCHHNHMACRDCTQKTLGSNNYGIPWTPEIDRQDGIQVLKIRCNGHLRLRYSCPVCRAPSCTSMCGGNMNPCFPRNRIFEEMMDNARSQTTVDMGVIQSKEILKDMRGMSVLLQENLMRFHSRLKEAEQKELAADKKILGQIQEKCRELKKLEQVVREAQMELKSIEGNKQMIIYEYQREARETQKMELDEYQKQRMRENKQKMELYLVELEEIISQKREDLRIQEQEFERKAKKAQTEQLVAIDKLGKLQARIKKLELMILDLETKKEVALKAAIEKHGYTLDYFATLKKRIREEVSVEYKKKMENVNDEIREMKRACQKEIREEKLKIERQLREFGSSIPDYKSYIQFQNESGCKSPLEMWFQKGLIPEDQKKIETQFWIYLEMYMGIRNPKYSLEEFVKFNKKSGTIHGQSCVGSFMERQRLLSTYGGSK